MSEQLAIGTRIQFVKEITQDATGDTPMFLLAEEGDIARIIGYSEIPNFEYLYKVQMDFDRKGKYQFYAKRGDFKFL